jgi:isopenicillin N synthase-like dioxygenase
VITTVSPYLDDRPPRIVASMAVAATAAAAAQQLRSHGWCLLQLTPDECRSIDAANRAAAEFFVQPMQAKTSMRRAASTVGGALPPPAGDGASTVPARPRVATGGVGFLTGRTREWFHLAADDETLSAMRWPSAVLQATTLRLLGIMRQACTDVLHQLTRDSDAAAKRLAARAAETRRWGDPSVLDLFFYHNASDGGQLENMSCHSDPGVLTVTPCSAVPGLMVQDADMGEWVDAETAEICGVSGKDGNHVLLLFAGDTMEELGLGSSTAHRVRRAAAPRLSLVYEMRLWECQHEASDAGQPDPSIEAAQPGTKRAGGWTRQHLRDSAESTDTEARPAMKRPKTE